MAQGQRIVLPTPPFEIDTTNLFIIDSSSSEDKASYTTEPSLEPDSDFSTESDKELEDFLVNTGKCLDHVDHIWGPSKQL